MEKKYISVKEMCDYLGICLSTARKMTQIKGFPSVKVGRRIIINRLALDEWLEQDKKQ